MCIVLSPAQTLPFPPDAGNFTKSVKKKCRRAGALRARPQNRARRPRVPAGPGTTDPIPRCWFLDPLRAQLAARIRPPTRLTRRRLLEVSLPLPLEAFEAFMAPVLDGDAAFLRPPADRPDAVLARDAGGRLLPTKVRTASTRRFEFIVRRPMVTDRLFQLELADLKPGPAARPGKAGTPWRRGMGCTRLQLAKGSKGKGTLISQVAGNVVIIYTEPTKFRAMPTLTLRFFAMSMDHTGHINWPYNFSDTSKAVLRKLARNNLAKMMDSAEYPTDPRMQAALRQQSNQLLLLTSSPNDPAQ